jgi:hypothetical protein
MACMKNITNKESETIRKKKWYLLLVKIQSSSVECLIAVTTLYEPYSAQSVVIAVRPY